MMSKAIIKMDHPKSHNDAKLEQIELREPTVDDLLALDEHKGEMARDFFLLVNTSEQSPETIKALDARDYLKACRHLSGFLG